MKVIQVVISPRNLFWPPISKSYQPPWLQTVRQAHSCQNSIYTNSKIHQRAPNQLHNNRSTQPAGNLALSKIFAIFARDRWRQWPKINQKVDFTDGFVFRKEWRLLRTFFKNVNFRYYERYVSVNCAIINLIHTFFIELFLFHFCQRTVKSLLKMCQKNCSLILWWALSNNHNQIYLEQDFSSSEQMI